VFSDFKGLAKQLLTLTNSDDPQYYAPAFQLALDMLFRLKQYDRMVNVMLDHSMIFEALTIV
jgi:hypothetical protein